MSGYYELKRSGDQYMFNLKAGNHEVILTSERYTTKASAQDGIASVRQNSPIDERYQRKTATNGSPYFSLSAANGQSIGRSEMYSSTAARDAGIASVKSNGPSIVVKDNT
ncbi:YegP family protein [Achromobacter aegrifaciens]|uniref:YegP family protein n=1 Tax=Achromobacter aegrifaciens TaxID=1287736 RepID=A0ABU2DE70_ACHAE|nr:YegP family protein [Achromobacter aegrifaciens]MDR7946312.1 YegP family protein [Achromobacter aegrifaciens]